MGQPLFIESSDIAIVLVLALFISYLNWRFFNTFLMMSFSFFSLLSFIAYYPQFSRRALEIEEYLFNMSHIFFFQCLAIFSAVLFSHHSNDRQETDKIIYWAFFLQCLGIIFRCVVHTFNYPSFHWVQIIEIILTGIILIFIPVLGLLFFYVRQKMAQTIK